MYSYLPTILIFATSYAHGQTLPLLCGNSLTDSTACEFKGGLFYPFLTFKDYCSYIENFDGPLRATDFLIYDGNPAEHEFVVESGKPRIVDGQLVMPLGRTEDFAKSGANIVSTTRFLNYGSFEARLKVCSSPHFTFRPSAKVHSLRP
jgi:hypothetical protein